MEPSNSCRKSLVASRDGDLSKPATNSTMGRGFELKDDVNCERAPAIPGARAFDTGRRQSLAIVFAAPLPTLFHQSHFD